MTQDKGKGNPLHAFAERVLEQGNFPPGRLMAGNLRFWTIQEATGWLQQSAALTDTDAENIAGQALEAARKGLLVTRTYPTGVEQRGQRSAGIGGREWYFFADDFNTWLAAAGLTVHRLPTAEADGINLGDLVRRREVLSAMDQPSRRAAQDALGIKQVSAAPPPIKPLPSTVTGMGSAPPPAPVRRGNAAKWHLWALVKHVELWEAVCLMENVEPSDDVFRGPNWRTVEPPWYSARYAWLMRFIDDGATFSEVLDSYGPEREQRVLLSEFARLAVKLWPDEVPEQLRELASQPAGTNPPKPDLPEVVDVEARTPKGSPAEETKEQRQERRYRMCVDAGLKLPDSTYGALPRGIKQLAAREGITRQAFSEDVKAHIGRLHGR